MSSRPSTSASTRIAARAAPPPIARKRERSPPCAASRRRGKRRWSACRRIFCCARSSSSRALSAGIAPARIVARKFGQQGMDIGAHLAHAGTGAERFECGTSRRILSGVDRIGIAPQCSDTRDAQVKLDADASGGLGSGRDSAHQSLPTAARRCHAHKPDSHFAPRSRHAPARLFGITCQRLHALHESADATVGVPPLRLPARLIMTAGLPMAMREIMGRLADAPFRL